MKIIFFFVLFSSGSILAQNLVVNPGFEECWTYQMHLNEDEATDTFFVKGWSHIYGYNRSSVDYYHEGNFTEYKAFNLKDNFFNIPDNHWGYYPAHSGKAYIGMIPFSAHGYMEHISGTLSDSMVARVLYEISFYVCFVKDSSLLSLKKMEMAFSSDNNFLKTKKRGSYFDSHSAFNNESYYDTIFNQFKIRSDVDFEILPFISDSVSWVKLSNIYLAKGGEKYFTIGIFYQGDQVSKKLNELSLKYISSLTCDKEKKMMKNIKRYGIPFISYNAENKIITRKGGKLGGLGYYFIDDVSITPIKE